ncbi:response regulator [bacterium]|nr:response regulator [bacterium]
MLIDKMNIAILDDDLYFNRMLTHYVKTICSKRVYKVIDFNIESYLTPENFIKKMKPNLDILLLDYYLTDADGKTTISGEEVLERMQFYCRNCRVIMISGQKSIPHVIKMLSKGVYIYINKNANTNNRVGHLIQDIIRRDNRYIY